MFIVNQANDKPVHVHIRDCSLKCIAKRQSFYRRNDINSDRLSAKCKNIDVRIIKEIPDCHVECRHTETAKCFD